MLFHLPTDNEEFIKALNSFINIPPRKVERDGLTPEERRATLAEATEDVARDDQIFILYGMEMAKKKKIAEETVSPKNSDHPAAISSATGAKILNNLDNLVKKISRKKLAKFQKEIVLGKEGYRKLAGEVEARNIEKRLGLTPEERRATLAEATEDVARDDQIFILYGAEVAEKQQSRFIRLTRAEFAKLSSIIMTRQYTYKRPSFDYAFTEGKFYVYNYLGDGYSNVIFAVPISKKYQEIITILSESIDNGIIGDTTSFDLLLKEIQSGKGGHSNNIINAIKERRRYKDIYISGGAGAYNQTGGFSPISDRSGGGIARRGESGDTNESANQDVDYRFSIRETDPEILEQLNNGETVKAYRAMQVIDGKLYPPMSAKVEGKLREPIELGVWERAEERRATLAEATEDVARDDQIFILYGAEVAEKTKGNADRTPSEFRQPTSTKRSPSLSHFGAKLRKDFESAIEGSGVEKKINQKGKLEEHEFLYKLDEALSEDPKIEDNNSDYVHIGEGVTLRLSDHYANGKNFKDYNNSFQNFGIVVLPPKEHRNKSIFKGLPDVEYIRLVLDYIEGIEGSGEEKVLSVVGNLLPSAEQNAKQLLGSIRDGYQGEGAGAIARREDATIDEEELQRLGSGHWGSDEQAPRSGRQTARAGESYSAEGRRVITTEDGFTLEEVDIPEFDESPKLSLRDPIERLREENGVVAKSFKVVESFDSPDQAYSFNLWLHKNFRFDFSKSRYYLCNTKQTRSITTKTIQLWQRDFSNATTVVMLSSKPLTAA